MSHGTYGSPTVPAGERASSNTLSVGAAVAPAPGALFLGLEPFERLIVIHVHKDGKVDVAKYGGDAGRRYVEVDPVDLVLIRTT